jgi:cell division protein ZapA
MTHCRHAEAAKSGVLALRRGKEGWAMAQVTIVVNGRSFRMGCREGEEARVQELAGEIDMHVQRIKAGSRAVQDERLFLMAAIMMADQLWDAREEVQRLQRLAGDLRAYQVIDGGAQAIQRDLNRTLETPGKIEALHQRSNGSV